MLDTVYPYLAEICETTAIRVFFFFVMFHLVLQEEESVMWKLDFGNWIKGLSLYNTDIYIEM